MQENSREVVVIGGSLGGMDAVGKILHDLPYDFAMPIVIVLHRLKNVKSALVPLLDQRSGLPVTEIEDKMEMHNGMVYVAPANYHVLIEKERTFALDCSPPVNYCRPSIDVMFESAAAVLGSKLIGVILTGANHDGSKGLSLISKQGGTALVQDPATAESDIMPVAAIQLTEKCEVMDISGIKSFLIAVSNETRKNK
ncbi:chemotaxis protein CheB [Cytophagaceae bacterium ABcell3]|nr:chemotaxis protein CheB [Cytophagaceae bacterium ABcell3]